MATVDEVARQALTAVGSDAGVLLATKWASERYRQLSNRTKFRHLRRIGELVIPADINAGTVDCVEGSDVIVGDATAVAAWTPDIVGRYFRGRRNWYRIALVDTANNRLRLESVFTEDDATDVGYHIVPQRVRVSDTVRQLGDFVHMRLHRKLVSTGLTAMNMEHPARIVIAGSGPEVVIEIGDDLDGCKQVEFYPYCTSQEMIRYVYWPVAAELRAGDTLPRELDEAVLRDGVLIDVMRFEMSKALKANQPEVAATWRNEARTQETTWQNRIDEAVKADRALDDVTLILHTRGRPVAYDSSDPWIKTGRQDAANRIGNWP